VRAALSCGLAGPILALALALPAWAQNSGPGRLYTPGPFERLEISGSANVRLSQGPREEIFIAGDDEVQKGVELELRRGRLTIQPNGGWKFWNSDRLQIDVTVRRLEQLELSGASDLLAPGTFRAERLSVTISGSGLARFDDLQAEQLRFGISGAGEGLLRGQVAGLNVSISGKGKLQAEQLRAHAAAVSISGVGSASVWATDALRISVSGIGTVDYWGRPQLVRSTSGMANITARGEAPPAAP